uniref:Uncharacterized protein n=1 Tax=Monodelphis domestica TaxID=13616 RepID=A0A5F8H9N3_MONDO
MAAQGEPQVSPSFGLLENLLETLIWSLLPCLLLHLQRLSWTQHWQHSMSRTYRLLRQLRSLMKMMTCKGKKLEPSIRGLVL